MSDGQLTAKVAEKLTPRFNRLGYDIYYDHGKTGKFVGTIPISLDESLTSKNQVSQLDIAVVKHDKVIALIEIEETSNSPKTIVGDIFTTFMGNSVHLPDREIKAKVGTWTTLIVLYNGPDDERITKFSRMANQVKSSFGTGISALGNIVVQYFSDEKSLESTLRKEIEEAIQRSS